MADLDDVVEWDDQVARAILNGDVVAAKLTKREVLAAVALHGLLARPPMGDVARSGPRLARTAVELASALLEALVDD